MAKHVALFVAWGLVGFGLSMEVLYGFTPIGLLGMLIIVPAIYVLTGGDWGRAPGRWGLAAGPAAFCFLVASSGVEDAVGWYAAGALLLAIGLFGFAVSGRARCHASSIQA